MNSKASLIFMLVVICISLFGLTKVIYDYFKHKEPLTFSPGANVTEQPYFYTGEHSESDHTFAIIQDDLDYVLSVSFDGKVTLYGKERKTLTVDFSKDKVETSGDLPYDEATFRLLEAIKIYVVDSGYFKSQVCSMGDLKRSPRP